MIDFEDARIIAVGIDPDLRLSGIAALFDKKTLFISRMTLWDLFDFILDYDVDLPIRIEAGWLNAKGLSFHAGAMRAVSVGQNHAVGKLIYAFCQEYEIPAELVKPTKNKLTHAEFNEIISQRGMEPYKKTNQEERDAARLLLDLF